MTASSLPLRAVVVLVVLCTALSIFLIAVLIVRHRHERLVARTVARPARRDRVLTDAIDLELIGGGGDVMGGIPAPPPAYFHGHTATETPPQYAP